MPADPRLGALRSAHRPAVTYPILFSLIGLSLAAGGLFVGFNGDSPGFAVAAAAVLSTSAYLYSSLRRRLFLYEHGLLLRAGGQERSILWRDITAITPTYSSHQHPDTIIDVILRSGTEPRLVLRMTWSNHQAIRKQLWSLIESSAAGA